MATLAAPMNPSRCRRHAHLDLTVNCGRHHHVDLPHLGAALATGAGALVARHSANLLKRHESSAASR
jgi:hypothetical protein